MGARSPRSACCWCVLGFAALVFSLVATIATVTLNGVLFLIAGAAEIAIGMHSRTWGLFFLWVIGGALYLAAGVICIVNPVLASVVLTLLLGAGLIAAGVVRFYLSLSATARSAARCWYSSPRRSQFFWASSSSATGRWTASTCLEPCSESIFCFMGPAG